MKLETLEKMADSGARALDANPRLSRRIAMAAPFLLGGCASLGIEPTREELAFYERLKSIPRGKVVPITEFPEIMAGVEPSKVMVEPENHKPPIGIDYYVNTKYPLTPIVAPARGRVWTAGIKSDNPANGVQVVMSHGWHYTQSAHMHPLLLVKEGQFVDRGTVIGFGYNTGGNSKGIFHYHLGTFEPTFDPIGETADKRIMLVTPRLYGLGTWNGEDIDSAYSRDIEGAKRFVNRVGERLPADKASELSRRPTLSTQIGYLKNLQTQGSVPRPVMFGAEEGREIDRLISIRPTYTVFVNPKRPELFHVVGL